jgi:hypothetical protein
VRGLLHQRMRRSQKAARPKRSFVLTAATVFFEPSLTDAAACSNGRFAFEKNEHGPVQSGLTHVVSNVFLGWFTLRSTKPVRFFRHAYSLCRNTRQRHSFSDEPPGYQRTGSPIHQDCLLRDGPTDTRCHDPKKTRWPEVHGCG